MSSRYGEAKIGRKGRDTGACVVKWPRRSEGACARTVADAAGIWTRLRVAAYAGVLEKHYAVVAVAGS